MPKQIFGVDSVVTSLNRAFNDQSPANAVYNNQVAQANTVGTSNFALSFGAAYAGLTEDALAAKILGNLGVLPNTGLQAAVKDYLVAVGKANVGIVALQLADILSGLENATGDQAPYAPLAVKWNAEVTSSYTYSANPANTGPSPVGTDDGAVTGVTLTLTSGDDFLSPQSAEAKFKTTANNDTIVATGANFVSADVIDGGAGTDILRASLNSDNIAATISNVEQFFIKGDAAYNFDLKNVTGVQQVWNDTNGFDLTLKNVVLGTTIGVKDTGVNTTVEFAKATGTTDAATVVLSGATGGTVKIDAIETLALQSTVKANSLTLSANTLETVTITGDKGLALIATNATAASLKAVDASAATAAVSIDVQNNANGVNVKGSTGADTINATGATKAATIDGGTGADTIIATANKGHTLTGGAGADAYSLAIGGKGAAETTGSLTTGDLTTSAKLIAAAVKITDFATGDTLSLLTSATKYVAADVVKLTGTQVENLAATGDLLNIVSDLTDTNLPAGSGDVTTIVGGIGGGKAVSFTVGGNAYIFVNDSVAGLSANDVLIQLTGVTAPATITFA
jgi:hypothetical protein